MQYALLIYVPADNAPSPEQQAAMSTEWFDYTQAMKDAGVHRGGEALHPVESATTVQLRDGQTITADGPFAETKEILAGFYLLEVEDLDAALAWGARCPAAPYGTIELRPVVEFASMPSA